MNVLTYNAAMLVGTALLGGGASIEWGIGVGAMVTGAVMIVLTVVGAVFSVGRGAK